MTQHFHKTRKKIPCQNLTNVNWNKNEIQEMNRMHAAVCLLWTKLTRLEGHLLFPNPDIGHVMKTD